MTCRKQTVSEALAAAKKQKRRALSKMEKRVVTLAAKTTPVLLCGPTRQLEGKYGELRCKKVKKGRVSFTVCR